MELSLPSCMGFLQRKFVRKFLHFQAEEEEKDDKKSKKETNKISKSFFKQVTKPPLVSRWAGQGKGIFRFGFF